MCTCLLAIVVIVVFVSICKYIITCILYTHLCTSRTIHLLTYKLYTNDICTCAVIWSKQPIPQICIPNTYVRICIWLCMIVHAFIRINILYMARTILSLYVYTLVGMCMYNEMLNENYHHKPHMLNYMNNIERERERERERDRERE